MSRAQLREGLPREVNLRYNALFTQGEAMHRLISIAVVMVCALGAQTKKIVVRGDAKLIQDLQSVTDKARIVPITDQNVMTEIVDADAYVGNIKPAEVRAGKKLKWVAIMSAGVENVLFMSGSND